MNKVEIEISGQNAGAVKSINGVSKELLDMDRIASGVTGNLGSLGRSISSMLNPSVLLGAGLATAFTGAVALIGKSIILADELDKMSQKTGMSVETLSQLKYAADLSNTSMETLEKGIRGMSRTVIEAISGNKEASETFVNLGVDLFDNEKHLKNNERLFFEVANSLSKMENGAIKTGLATKVLKDRNGELIPMLNEGEDGLHRMMLAADQMGLTISTQTAKDVDALMDELERFKAMLNGIAIQALPKVSSALMVLGFDLNMLWKGRLDVPLAHAFGLQYAEDMFRDYQHQIRKTGETVRDAAKDNNEMVNSLSRQNSEVERLNKQWDEVGQKLRLDINTLGLDPQEEKIVRLSYEVEAYRDKYAQIPGALKLINAYLDVQYQKLISIQSIQKPPIPDKPKPQTEGAERAGIDVDGIAAEYDIQRQYADNFYAQSRQARAEFTAWELADMVLRTEATSVMFGNMAGAMLNFANLSKETNRTMFGWYKAFAMGQAGIDTYNAAIAAYKSMVGIPIVGPGLAIAAAAAATAFGLSNIARIASMQPGSTGGGGVAISGASIPSIRNNYNDTTNNSSKSIVVNVYGFVDKDLIARELIPSLEKAWNDGVGR